MSKLKNKLYALIKIYTFLNYIHDIYKNILKIYEVQ